MIPAPSGCVVRLTYPERTGRSPEDVDVFAFSEEGEPLLIGRRGLVFVDEYLDERWRLHGTPRSQVEWEIHQRTEPETVSELLTIEEAAKVLQIGRGTAYAQAQLFERTNGTSGLPVVRVGRSLRVPRAALDKMLLG